ncbi:MAG: hypothetical protein WAU86_02200 [Oricola sp.]
MNGFTAGIIYFALVFAAGFVLGSIRTLLLMPVLGPTVSVLIELPFMLTIAWFVCRWIVRRFTVSAAVEDRIIMGATAFVLLMVAEYLLAFALAGISPDIYFAGYASVPGVIGLAGQVAFAVFPVLQARQTG